jgi:hypothetical protein
MIKAVGDLRRRNQPENKLKFFNNLKKKNYRKKENLSLFQESASALALKSYTDFCATNEGARRPGLPLYRDVGFGFRAAQ